MYVCVGVCVLFTKLMFLYFMFLATCSYFEKKKAFVEEKKVPFSFCFSLT